MVSSVPADRQAPDLASSRKTSMRVSFGGVGGGGVGGGGSGGGGDGGGGDGGGGDQLKQQPVQWHWSTLDESIVTRAVSAVQS